MKPGPKIADEASHTIFEKLIRCLLIKYTEDFSSFQQAAWCLEVDDKLRINYCLGNI